MSGRVKHPLSDEQVREVLRQVKFPGFSRDIVSFGIVKSIGITDQNDVTIALHVMTRDPEVPRQIQRDVEAALKQCDGIGRANIEMTAQQPPQQGQMPMAGGVEYLLSIARAAKARGLNVQWVNIEMSNETLASAWKRHCLDCGMDLKQDVAAARNVRKACT